MDCVRSGLVGESPADELLWWLAASAPPATTTYGGGSTHNSSSTRRHPHAAAVDDSADALGLQHRMQQAKSGQTRIMAALRATGQVGAGEAVPSLPSSARCALYTHSDVTVKADVAAAVDLAIARHGRLDVLYSNAGS
ncbi:hypothetical protein EE612_059449 [Oryza sativa]|nr:hypothetical protein EE612_059449 [Oryza sativa]